MTALGAAYVAAVIVVGFGSLAWATAAYALNPAIADPGPPRLLDDRELNALVFWVVMGLLGANRARTNEHVVLTFHLPFIVAAMILGGPVAAGWVGAVSTLELREIREVPWFGTLYNHAVAAFGGVVGGLVGALLHETLARLVDPQAATFLAALSASFVFCAINVGLSVAMVGIRERLTPVEAAAVFDRSFRRSTIAEVVLGWVLAVGYLAIAWWAPIVCIALVLLVWQANGEHDQTTHDSMTGLLNRRGFETRLSQTVWRAARGRQRAALLMVDLDGFKAINDSLGHDAGDEVIRVAGTRLRASIRYTDSAARMGGDEFAVLLVGVPDRPTTQAVVDRIHAELCAPLTVGERKVSVGASIGVTYLDSDLATTALKLADQAMFEAKRRGGGVELAGMT